MVLCWDLHMVFNMNRGWDQPHFFLLKSPLVISPYDPYKIPWFYVLKI